MMRFGLKIIILGLLVIFATSCVQIRVFGKRMDVVDIPHIETWKEIIYSEDSNNDKNDRGQVFIRWFADPQGNGYAGSILYHQLIMGSDPYPIVKSWNFKEINDGYDWSKTRVALWLGNEGWFVGDIGERLKVHRIYRYRGTYSVTYRFLGRNSSVSKTIFLQPPSPPVPPVLW